MLQQYGFSNLFLWSIKDILQDTDPTHASDKELKRLQFYGAGPKITGVQHIKDEKPKTKTRGKKISYDYDPVSSDKANSKLYQQNPIFLLWILDKPTLLLFTACINFPEG